MTDREPRFFILMATHRGVKYIHTAIESVIDQSYEDWNLIIVPNGEDDGTMQVLRRMGARPFPDVNLIDRHDKISYIESGVANKSNAMNLGVIGLLSQPNVICNNLPAYICVLDSDDLWTPNKLSRQAEYLMQHPQTDVLGTQMEYINDYGDHHSSQPSLLPCTQTMITRWFLRGENPIANSSVAYKISIHLTLGGFYNPAIEGIEDYEFWYRCLCVGKQFANLEDIALKHRIHTASSFNSTQCQADQKALVDQFYRGILSEINEVDEVDDD